MRASGPEPKQSLDLLPAGAQPAAGARIANARGIPGTIGCLGVTLDDHRLVIITAHHILFGLGAGEGDPVWLLDGDRAPRCIARSMYGRSAMVHHAGDEVYVDCALAAVDPGVVSARWGTARLRAAPPPAAGDHVTKHGFATGSTEGVVESASGRERVVVGGRALEAPGQIVMRPRTPENTFSAPGDSGATLLNARGEIAGLLWGTNERGQSVACPIAPVLSVLRVRPVCVLTAPGMPALLPFVR
jgi:hypothetical protein